MCLQVHSCSGHRAALAGAGRARRAGSCKSCSTVLPAAGTAWSRAAACRAIELPLQHPVTPMAQVLQHQWPAWRCRPAGTQPCTEQMQDAWPWTTPAQLGAAHLFYCPQRSAARPPAHCRLPGHCSRMWGHQHQTPSPASQRCLQQGQGGKQRVREEVRKAMQTSGPGAGRTGEQGPTLITRTC